MKKWNFKTKAEQLFMLCLIFICAFGCLCVSGCTGNSCETPKWSSVEENGSTAVGISVPGCGGCLTPGKGCDSCLWSQSCKYIDVSAVEETAESESELEFTGCDVRYYDGGCMGCGYQEKSCYVGYIKIESNEDGAMDGYIYSSGNGEESYLGCVDGSNSSCVYTDGVGKILLDELEVMIGVD